MTDYVQLQKIVIGWLFDQLGINEEIVRRLVFVCRWEGFVFWVEEEEFLRKTCGLVLPRGREWNIKEAFVEIVKEQVDDSGDELVIRNLLGFPLHDYGQPYDLVGWVENRGSGQNLLRTKNFAQPRALVVGDRLVTGEKVISQPRDGGNGAILVHLDDGRERGTWFSFASRTALAVLSPEDKVPEGLFES